MTLLLAVVVAALCNVFGQRAITQRAETSVAQLTLRAPSAVRPGLLFQAKITISVNELLPNAQLVLNRGWIDGLTLNTIEPSPVTETSAADGSLIFGIGTLQPGKPYTQYLEYQVSPTSLSSRAQSVTVLSGGVPAVSLHRTMTIIP